MKNQNKKMKSFSEMERFQKKLACEFEKQFN